MDLEEWRHLQEGDQVPFLVWTDHKKLEYIKMAWRLNPRQARWPLFFSCFNFTLSYIPGFKNVKRDALSKRDKCGREMDDYATLSLQHPS